MAVHKVSIKLYQGATFDETWTWSVGTEASNTPVNLTGCTAKAQIRSKIGSQEVLLELTTENNKIELGGTAGTIRVIITDEDTADIDWTTGVYDLFIYFPDGSAVARMAGNVTVTKGVTVRV